MSIWSGDLTLRDAQDLEDVATAAWLSEALFAALELGLFEALGTENLEVSELARRCGADRDATGRLVNVLAALGLVAQYDGRVACGTVARRHLRRGTDGYLGHSLAYRRGLATHWSRLAEAVRTGGSPLEVAEDEDEVAYRARVRVYLLAMDDVARHKAQRIAERVHLDRLLAGRSRHGGAVLDVAGGAGAVAAELLRRNPTWQALVLDMPEIVQQARQVWSERGDALTEGPGARLSFAEVDILSEPFPEPPDGAAGWDVVVLSNIVHAFGAPESGMLLDAAATAVAASGLVVVHDFWTDGPGRGPAKSALFDLHMLLHTYQGRVYPWSWARARLAVAGLTTLAPVSLGEGVQAEDTALVVGARDPRALTAVDAGGLERVASAALEIGFERTAPIDPEQVVTAAWVREKCRFGCAGHDQGGRCPPWSPAPADTRTLLDEYRQALLVRGAPPTLDFHTRMLALERAAFLQGFPRALAFTAGPCPLCAECEPGHCRRPAEARPSMEASGIDVYAAAATVGWPLEPVPDRESPVTYIGLLLVE